MKPRLAFLAAAALALLLLGMGGYHIWNWHSPSVVRKAPVEFVGPPPQANSSEEKLIRPEEKVIRETAFNPYPTAVRAELYAVEMKCPRNGGKCRPKTEWRRWLSAEQRKVFESHLITQLYEQPPMRPMCCVPHHFVKYFDAGGKELGTVEVCFCCGCARSALPLEENEYLEFAYDDMKRFIAGLGVPTDISCSH